MSYSSFTDRAKSSFLALGGFNWKRWKGTPFLLLLLLLTKSCCWEESTHMRASLMNMLKFPDSCSGLHLKMLIFPRYVHWFAP